MPLASRVLLAAPLSLVPVASVPFPVAAAQRHAPLAGSVQEVPGAGALSGPANRSVEAWFKTTSATDMPTVAYGPPGVANQYFGVYVNGTAIEVKTGTGTTITFPGSAALHNGAWHHLVVTYDSGAPAGNLMVYIDRVDFGTQTPVPAALNTTPDAAGFGAGKDEIPAFFNDSLDEVAIYSTVLSPTRSAATSRPAQGPNFRFPPPALGR